MACMVLGILENYIFHKGKQNMEPFQPFGISFTILHSTNKVQIAIHPQHNIIRKTNIL
jgi:hypothetical protein